MRIRIAVMMLSPALIAGLSVFPLRAVETEEGFALVQLQAQAVLQQSSAQKEERTRDALRQLKEARDGWKRIEAVNALEQLLENEEARSGLLEAMSSDDAASVRRQ